MIMSNKNQTSPSIDFTYPINDHEVDAMIQQTRPEIERAMKRWRRPQARVGEVRSALGPLLIAESDLGIAAIHFLFISGAERTLEMLRQKFDLIENEASTKRVGGEIQRFFKGDLTVMEREVDLSLIESEFKRRALTQLRKVPAGAVITYQALAAAVGNPDSQRAIGTTMATNPVPIIIPCHRVIRSDGTIGNYGGGVANKIKMLRAEGFEVGPDLRLPSRAVMGHRVTRIYCDPQCSAAKRANPSRAYIFADAAHAAHAGLRPCKLCHPS
jgi:O-6-methylguanine DNA methyltransferase